MERPLTSWKEIATHFNKSVRTVQRWEQQFGLPVRRPDAHNHGIVLAFPSELNLWLRTHVVVRGENGSSGEASRPENANESTLRLANSFSEFQRVRQRSEALVQTTRALLERVRHNYDQLKLTVGRNGDLYRRFDSQNGRTTRALANGARLPQQSKPARSPARAG
jgi:hypothetical protein